jgi:hypothetical protein
MDLILKQFIDDNLNYLIEKELHEQFFLHMLTLFDAQQIERDSFYNLIKYFNDSRHNNQNQNQNKNIINK